MPVRPTSTYLLFFACLVTQLVYINSIFAVPSQAPTSFNVSACTSTSIDASWNLPPAISRNGIITGFKLFYKRKEFHGPPTIINISNAVIHTKTVTGLDKYAVYEFQVLAFNSAGDGPKSSVIVQRTREDGK